MSKDINRNCRGYINHQCIYGFPATPACRVVYSIPLCCNEDYIKEEENQIELDLNKGIGFVKGL